MKKTWKKTPVFTVLSQKLTKFLPRYIAFIVVIIMMPPSVLAAPLMKGDGNGDGVINTADVFLVSKYVNGKTTITPEQLVALDVNNDGQVTAADGDLIKQFYLGVIASFPAPPVNTNHDPTIDTLPAQTLQLGSGDQQLDLATYLHDEDNDPLTVTAAINDNSIATVTVSGNTLTLMPIGAGQTQVTLTVSDGRGGTATASITVVVRSNQAPIGTDIPAQSLEAGTDAQELDLSTYFTDPENDAITYTANPREATIVGTSISGSKLILSPGVAGTTSVEVTATDASGNQVTKMFSVTVTASVVNAPPEVVSSIQTQVLCPVYTDSREYDLSQLFLDPDGDALTFTAVVSNPNAAQVSVSGNQLTLAPGTAGYAGAAVVTITATDTKGKTATYDLNVQAVQLITNGYVAINTKIGVPSITYDLSTFFPTQNSLSVYMATPSQTLIGPITLNGKVWTGTPINSDNWIVGADGKAVLLRVNVAMQTNSDPYFIQYIDGGDYRKTFQIRNPYVGTGQKFVGYTLEVFHFDPVKNSIKSEVTKVFDAPVSNIPDLNLINVIDRAFYDYMDVIVTQYYNYELILNIPGQRLTAIALKKDGRIVDVIGNPNGHDEILPNAGTIIRKSAVHSASQAYSLPGEWNLYPKGTYQYYGQQTP